MNRGKAALISVFIVGGGQIFTRRILTGVLLAVLFYGSIVFLKTIWTGLNIAFWGLVLAWTVVWLYNIYDAYRGETYDKPPCEKACPAGIAPWMYVNCVATACGTKYPFVPFFKLLGRICPAPCEENCTRKGIDAPVAIRYLKHGVDVDKPVVRQKKRRERIAVIGAGPSGLTAACILAQKGYEVVVYEREKSPGGIPAAMIPEFRLPQSLLKQELATILTSGITLKCSIEVGKDISFDTLLHDYDAVYCACGAWRSTRLGIRGEEEALDGFAVLKQIKQGKEFRVGTVAVIGGGNTAIDIARSLIRQGNRVTIYYRRRIEDMPAESENRVQAVEEGIEIIPLTIPVRLEKNHLVIARTECLNGRKGRVTIIEGSEFIVEVDATIIAIGQQPDSDFLKEYVTLDALGRVLTKHGRTSHARIFAGGDVVLGSATVAHAVGHGLDCAERIDLHLRKIPHWWARIFKRHYLPSVRLLPQHDIPRLTIPCRTVAERIKNFEEVEQTTSQDALQREACRCLSCPLRYRA